MKFLFDLFPVILFFAAFKYSESHKQDAAHWLETMFAGIGMSGGVVALDQAPILVATVVVIVATCAQIGWVWFRHGKVDKMLWVSLGLVVVFGSLTLALQDETFIKWKPTVLYWVFAATLFGAERFFGRNLMRAMLEQQLELPDLIWGRLNLAWAAFFTLMGVLNLAIAFNFSTDTWVNFKLFGGMGLMLVFILAQGMMLARYMPEDKDPPQAPAKD